MQVDEVYLVHIIAYKVNTILRHLKIIITTISDFFTLDYIK